MKETILYILGFSGIMLFFVFMYIDTKVETK